MWNQSDEAAVSLMFDVWHPGVGKKDRKRLEKGMFSHNPPDTYMDDPAAQK